MKFRNILLTAAAAAALALAPATAAQLRGEIVAMSGDTITVMSGGKEITYLIPTNVQIETAQRDTVTVSQLQTGQRVVLEVNEMQAAEGQAVATPQATHIRIEGDVEVDQ